MKINENHFENLASTIDIQRSTFNKPFQHKGSANLGELIPFYIEDVLPGSTYKIDTASFIRTGTLISPIMDNLYLDIYYFFVPKRIIWNHWKQFMGENDQSAWTQSTEYKEPNAVINRKNQTTGTTLFNYLTGCTTTTNANNNYAIISELPLRAYYEVCNTWFRNENTKAPTLYTKEDTTNTNISYEDKPYIANKFRDYFTSCLPAPQKGDPVSLSVSGNMNIIAGSTIHELGGTLKLAGVGTTGKTGTNTAYNLGIDYGHSNGDVYANGTGSAFATDSDSAITKTNLEVDLESATYTTINQLRFAFQLQKFYEKGGLYGTRYQETLKGMFGVNANNARLDIPEYLTGERIPINIDQVIATAQTGNNDSIQVAQGNTAGYSATGTYTEGFTKSFEEHGYIIGFMVLRQENTYSSAMPKMFLRRNKLDYYFPVFANIGNQPVYKKELNFEEYAASEEIFGYQEAWADYRYKPSYTSGLLNPNATNALSYWTLCDSKPKVNVISSQFTDATKTNLERALAVSSEASGAQYIFDMYVKTKATLPMPLFSIPGLIDHH